MKRSLLIILAVLFGCSNANKEKSVDYSETKNVAVESTSDFEIEKPGFNTMNILEEKLQDLYDLNYYNSNHPEFESDALNASSGLFRNLKEYGIISSINPISEIKSINDSTQSVLIEYTIKTGDLNRKDTLSALIITKKMMIENLEISSLNIQFLKSHN